MKGVPFLVHMHAVVLLDAFDWPILIRGSLSKINFWCEDFGRGIVLPSGIVQKIYNGTDWSWTKNNPDAEEPIEGEYQDDENGSVTLHIDTDRGQLKVYAYNYHNGYYAHDYSLTYNGKTQEGEI